MLGRVCRVVLAAACLFAAPAAPASAAITGPPQTVASGLSFPWEVVPMPDGRLLVTERPGRVRVIGASGALLSQPAYVSAAGSFLGLAIHPNYATNKFVYLYNKYSDGGVFKNRIQRFVDNGTTLSLSATILDGIPADQTSNGHDGGRIKFGPDGKLYVTTGDTFAPGPPQNLESLAGKILRLNAAGNAQDGTAPSDNPFQSGTNSKLVWSYGHRHPQGIAWDASGQLWETEHGPSGEAHAGGRCCRDELNKIDKGANYGWPAIVGDEQQAGMRSPVVSSGDTVAWAPGGAAFGPDGELYAPALIGQHLRQLSISGGQVTRQREHFRLDLGRLRTAVYSGGFLYLTTSNNSANEKVLRVPVNSQQQPATSVVWAVGDANANADSQATANRITGKIDRFLYLGDVYETGTAAEFANNFDPVWGRFKALTSPTPGNHEWANRATGYDPYWGARAPQTGGGHYYSFTENGWEVLSLNTEESMAAGSPQHEWLKQKLADGGNCRIAFFHRPRYVAPGSHSDATDVQPLWNLMANKVRLAVNGHAHAMMRAHPVDGVTELISGAGGHSHHAANPDPRFAFVNGSEFGVLRLKLNAVGSGGATWEHDFIATDDGAVLDSSSGACNPPPPPSGSYRDSVFGTSGLVSYWRLGESSGSTAADEKGANAGRYVGGPALGQSGAVAGSNTAVRFDGSNDEMSVAGPGLSTQGSLEGWFHWEAGVALLRDETAAGGWILAFDSGGQLAYRVGGTTFVTGRSTASVRNGWHHLVLTRSGSSTAFYVDGVLVHQGSGAGGAAAQMPWHVMRNGVHLDEYARGRADEVAIYNSALSAQTVQQHYNAGTSP